MLGNNAQSHFHCQESDTIRRRWWDSAWMEQTVFWGWEPGLPKEDYFLHISNYVLFVWAFDWQSLLRFLVVQSVEFLFSSGDFHAQLKMCSASLQHSRGFMVAKKDMFRLTHSISLDCQIICTTIHQQECLICWPDPSWRSCSSPIFGSRAAAETKGLSSTSKACHELGAPLCHSQKEWRRDHKPESLGVQLADWTPWVTCLLTKHASRRWKAEQVSYSCRFLFWTYFQVCVFPC